MIKLQLWQNKITFVMCSDAHAHAVLDAAMNLTPTYMFLPSFRGVPRKDMYLFDTKKMSKDGKFHVYYTYAGLYTFVKETAEAAGITVEETDPDVFSANRGLTLEAFREKVSGWGLAIEPRGYQTEAAWRILRSKTSLSQIATRAGKTLIAYMVFRYAMTELGVKNILMVVPSIQLVKQGFADFGAYGEFFKGECIWAQGSEVASSNLTIGTFQSLTKYLDSRSKRYKPGFFSKFDCLLVDEVHTAGKSDSIKSIVSDQFISQLKLRFGFSGTLPLKGTIENLQVQALFGHKIQDITAAELVESGYITKPDITQIIIDWKTIVPDSDMLSTYISNGEYLVSEKGDLLPKDERKFLVQRTAKLPYAFRQIKSNPQCSPERYCTALIDTCKANGSNLLTLEKMCIHCMPGREELIGRICKQIGHNTLLLTQCVEYSKHICAYLKETLKDRQVFNITGQVSIKRRQEIIARMAESEDCVLVASYGCMSTGITFKNLYNVVFCESCKSDIVNMQSIGRALGLTAGKTEAKIYDIIDAMPTGKIRQQGVYKAKIYDTQKFEHHKIFVKNSVSNLNLVPVEQVHL